ncbi:hypothetical protein K432DRAFT_379023 [Lepidopterella palustris CBS 459.81]|uniref:Uncharacterized protein n=1 Tax=Lepidopterella palustris CBS 459.81 TaxID=1314670 RepID=A0A8E2JIS2_9PEZI|nr:hypothetical protein K432DRAFT_379023 [Lepidopterella palustris CBS 459.81]
MKAVIDLAEEESKPAEESKAVTNSRNLRPRKTSNSAETYAKAPTRNARSTVAKNQSVCQTNKVAQPWPTKRASVDPGSRVTQSSKSQSKSRAGSSASAFSADYDPVIYPNSRKRALATHGPKSRRRYEAKKTIVAATAVNVIAKNLSS